MTGGVSVVVVAYGHADDLAQCLQPLAGEYPVLVVDNSQDAACAVVAAAAGASYFATESNLGFAAAVHLAFDVLASHDGHVLLLNPDAVIDSPAVATLAAFLEAPENDSVAAVAPRQFGDHGVEQRVQWPFPTPVRAWAAALGLGGLVRADQFLVGSILLLRGDALRDVGRFDQRFFLYAEESDWQRRAQARGWTVRLCEEVAAYHAGGGTGTDHELIEALFHSSGELLFRKWHGSLGWQSARVAAIVGAVLRALWRRGEARRTALSRARLYLRGPHEVASRRGFP
jgi:GT2 family glycosyltransferase